MSEQQPHKDEDAAQADGDTSVWLDVDGKIYADLRARRYQNYVLGAYSLMIPTASFDSQIGHDPGSGHGGLPGDG